MERYGFVSDDKLEFPTVIQSFCQTCGSLSLSLLVQSCWFPPLITLRRMVNQKGLTRPLRLLFVTMLYVIQMFPWNKFAVQLRSTLNNSTNASTGKSSNEIAYGMKLNDELNISNVASKN